MGLDMLEIVMEVEDEFDIKIADEAATSMRQIGDMARFVTWKLRSRWPRVPCPTARSFYVFRKALLECVPVNRRDVRPASKLAEIIPVWSRRRLLNALADAELWLPELERSRAVNWLGVALAIAVGVSVAIALGVSIGIFLGLIVGVMSLYVTGMLIYWSTIPLAICFPSGCRSVGDFVCRGTPTYENDDEIDPDVLDRVRRIVSEQMRVPIDQLSGQTRFVEDLDI